jgi:hypothetical protein
MNCYDCATQDHLNRLAVAVCHDCGAAACAEHSVARRHHLTRPAMIMRAEPVEPAARVLRCTTCDAAYAAAHGEPSRPERRPSRDPAGGRPLAASTAVSATARPGPTADPTPEETP